MSTTDFCTFPVIVGYANVYRLKLRSCLFLFRISHCSQPSAERLPRVRAENECMPRASCLSAVLRTLTKIFLPARQKSSADAKKFLPSVNFAEKTSVKFNYTLSFPLNSFEIHNVVQLKT
jgi:hypothetical protein